MFRRRTSSSGKIHYRINIDKSMCPDFVDIYIDGDTYQHSFNGSSLDIYRNKKIEVIRIGGQIAQKDQQYEYNVLLGVTGGVSKGTLTYLYEEDLVPNGGRPPFIPPGLPIGASAGYFPWYISLLWNNR